MKIAIIGAGNIGGNLARRWAKLGHDVSIANSRGPETLQDLVDETGVTATTVDKVVDGANLVVVTIPMKNVPSLPQDVLSAAADGAVVVDTNNYYPQQRDGRIAEIEDGLTESRWVSQQLGVPVVKVFNGVYAAHLLEMPQPESGERRALPVAGDDAAAKQTVIGLLDELGFDAVDAGGIDDSWRQQPGSPVYGPVLDAAGVREALAAASQERTAEWRA